VSFAIGGVILITAVMLIIVFVIRYRSVLHLIHNSFDIFIYIIISMVFNNAYV